MAKKKPVIRQADIVRVFAERLRNLRLARDMTQRDLATRAQVTVSYISRLEAGGAAPGIDLLERLAQALSLSVAELLPLPAAPTTEARRDQIARLFEAVLARSGQETLSLLELLLIRLAEAPAINR